jgi:hypothetical protein
MVAWPFQYVLQHDINASYAMGQRCLYDHDHAMFYFVKKMCCSQNDNYTYENLARFGYKLNIKIKNLKHFWLHAWTMYKNLESGLKFWLNHGYWKYQKIDFWF